jgi:hypothetical protein
MDLISVLLILGLLLLVFDDSLRLHLLTKLHTSISAFSGLVHNLWASFTNRGSLTPPPAPPKPPDAPPPQ